MKTEKSEKVSVEKLAQLTQKEFSSVRSQVDKLDQKIEDRFELVMEELRDLKQSNHDILNAVKAIMDYTVGKFENRLETFEKRIAAIERSKR